MIKKYLVVLAIAAPFEAFCAAVVRGWKVHPGYWYNATDDTVEVRIENPIDGPKEKDIIPLEPGVGLVKMNAFKKINLRADWHDNESVRVEFRLKGKKFDSRGLDHKILGDLGSAYVIVFRKYDDDSSDLRIGIVPEKEFRERFAKELEACPLPGGVQRIIGGYCLPETEKTKKEE